MPLSIYLFTYQPYTEFSCDLKWKITFQRVILHGVNVIVKGYPWIPNVNEWNIDTSLSAKDLATLHDLGVNVIRLGAMWPGVEPTRGLYNRVYLQQIRKIVSMAAEYGIYTLLDMHQDVLSEKFCGEGVPSWAAVPYKPLSSQESFPVPVETMPFTKTSAIDGFPTRQDWYCYCYYAILTQALFDYCRDECIVAL